MTNDGGINRRNAETVFQALKTMDEITRENQLMLQSITALITELGRRVSVLEDAETKRRIDAMGTGPTHVEEEQ